jgi:hypothetical protein
MIDLMSQVGFDEWANQLGIGAVSDSGLASSGFHAWLRVLFDVEGPLDLKSVEIAFRLRQAELAVWAIGLARRDIERTTECRPEITLVTFDEGDMTAAYNGSHEGVSLMSVDPPWILTQVADKLQDGVVEDLRRGWPTCETHDSGAFAEVRDDQALWWCRKAGHPVAVIGELPG